MGESYHTSLVNDYYPIGRALFPRKKASVKKQVTKTPNNVIMKA